MKLEIDDNTAINLLVSILVDDAERLKKYLSYEDNNENDEDKKYDESIIDAINLLLTYYTPYPHKQV